MLICILGRGASGKDTLKSYLMNHFSSLKELPLFTTRPQRPNESNDAYLWARANPDNYIIHIQNSQIDIFDDNYVETRSYETVHGTWLYGTTTPSVHTVDGKTIDLYDLTKDNYIAATVPGQLKKYVEEYGKENIAVIYLNCPRDICESRMRKRDASDPEEVTRRLLSDDKDYGNDAIDEIKHMGLNAVTLFVCENDTPLDLMENLIITNFWKKLDIPETL